MTFDHITAESLVGAGGTKWTSFPGALGMWVAEMDFGLAEPIKQTLHRVVDQGQTGYLAPGWVDQLQQAVVGFVGSRYGWTVEPGNVRPVPDVLSVLVLTMKYHLREGARVVVPTPAYMPFMTLPGAHGRELVQLPMTRDAAGWSLDLDRLDDTLGEGDLLVLCNPYNPLGKVWTREEMVAISEVVEKHHARVFNDEIHAPLTLHGAQHVPYPTVSQAANAHSITAMSASKAWNLAGLKCAQMIVNDEDAKRLEEFKPDLHECSTPGLLANITAFTEGGEWLSEVITYLEGNQQLIVDLLPEVLPGVEFVPNEATYLAWFDCTALELAPSPQESPNRVRATTIASAFLKQGVALNDGALCGEVGRGSVRMNFGTARPIVREALERMGRAL